MYGGDGCLCKPAKPVRGRHRGHVAVGSDVGPAGDMSDEGGVKQPGEKIVVTAGKNPVVVAAYQRLVVRQFRGPPCRDDLVRPARPVRPVRTDLWLCHTRWREG